MQAHIVKSIQETVANVAATQPVQMPLHSHSMWHSHRTSQL